MDASGRSKTPLTVAEALLALALVFAPLAIGTVEWWSLSIVAALAGGAAVAAAMARPHRLVWPVSAALAVSALVGFQALPLPPALFRRLSPHAAALLEDTLGNVGWHALSLDPAATAREFGRLLAYSAAFYAASRLAGDRASTRRLTRMIGAMALVEVAIIGAHALTNTSMVYGVVPLSLAYPIFGTFGNANHLAGYLTLGVPMIAVMALRAEEPAPRYLLWLAAAVTSGLVVLTASRSGIAGLLLALLALWLLQARRATQDSRLLRVGLGVAFALLCAAGAISFLEADQFAKMQTLVHPVRLLDELKVRAWRDVPALVRDYWVTGVGRGAFEQIFPSYKHLPEQLTFTHVECAPLQALADLGVFAGGALLVAWMAALGRAVRREGTVLRAGAAVAIAAITLHELGDFSLDAAGAVGVTTAVLWGLATPTDESRERRGRRQLAVAIGAVALGVFALSSGYRGDLARDIAAVEARAKDPTADLEPLLRQAIDRHPAEPWFPLMAGVNDLTRKRQPTVALRYLNRALALDAQAWKPHLVIAEALWQLGRRSQALLEYRLAYIRSRADASVAAALLSHPGVHFDTDLGEVARDDVALLEPLATFLEHEQHDEDAEKTAQHLIALAPKDQVAHRVLARLALRRQRFQDLLAHASQLAGDDREALELQVTALVSLGRPAEAERLLVRRFEVTPTPSTGFLLAERLIARGEGAGALAVLGRVQKEDLFAWQLGRLHILTGRALESAGKGREAIVEIGDGARIDPSEANRLELGAAYERAGLPRDALLVYRGLVRSSSAPSADLKARVARTEEALGVSRATPDLAPVAPTATGPELETDNPR